jgi:uncharacterized protein YyaL (SSP411 family)
MTVYAACNARLISSYLLAAQVMNIPTLETMALGALDWLSEHMIHREGSICHYSINGRVGLPGQLTDQVWTTRALLDAYERHPNKAYLETAIALMHFTCQELLDEETGLFYDYPEDAHAMGRLAVREQPLTENALAAECLLRMFQHSKRQNLRDTGLLVLSGCLDKYRRTGIQGAIYACIVSRAIENKWL